MMRKTLFLKGAWLSALLLPIMGCDLLAEIGEYCVKGTEGCGGVETGGGTTTTTATGGGGMGGTTSSTAAGCGDGEMTENEECDDGNLVDADGCEANCTLPKCGNGIVDPGEVCLSKAKVQPLGGTENYGLALIDCDNDSDIDILVSGNAGSSGGGIHAFRNDNTDFSQSIYTDAPASSSIIGLTETYVGGKVEIVGVATYKGKTVWISPVGECQLTIVDGATNAITTAGVVDLCVLNGDANPDLDVAKVYTPDSGSEAPIYFTLNHDTLEDVAGPSFSYDMPLFIAAGQLRGDELDELIVPIDAPTTLVILENQGSGYLPAGYVTDIPLAAIPVDATIGDLDNDGDNDIVTANLESNSIAVLKNLGSGTFGTQTPEPSVFGNNGVPAGKPKSIALGDMNNDGYLDAVTANFDDSAGKSSVTVFLNDGKGKLLLATKATFPLVDADAPYEVGRQPQSVKLGDLNGDGVLDIVTANAFVENGSSSISVILSNP